MERLVSVTGFLSACGMAEPFRSLVFLLVLAGISLGCSERPPAPTARLLAGTQEAAVLRVRSFLDAYRAGDAPAALSHLCEQDDDTRAFLERSLAPGSPFRIASYDIASVTPMWERTKALYLVNVLVPRRSGEPMEQGYRVRAEDGCIERLFPGVSRPGPTSGEQGGATPPILPPPAHGRSDDDEERWGPPLPAAPVSADDEVIDL